MSWLPGVLVAIVALCAAWVALQQMAIARKKLNLDLFDRRFTIYVATEDYLVACLNNKGGTQEDFNTFYKATRAAPFLFDVSLVQVLERARRASMDVQIFSGFLSEVDLPEHQSHMNQYLDATRELLDIFTGLRTTFNAAIDLSDTKAYPMRSVLGIPTLWPVMSSIPDSLCQLGQKIRPPKTP